MVFERAFLKSLFLSVALLSLTACEQPYLAEAEYEPESNVVLSVQGFDLVPFDGVDTRSIEEVQQVCSRLNFVVYDADTKVKSIAQKRGDAGFGTIAISLPQGHYTYAVIAHSSEGSATVTTLEKISFKNNRVTDTFSHSGELEVGEEPVKENVQLRRNTAMFRLILTQPLSQQVAQLKFYYTGGSSTLSALTGYGSVDSRQTVILTVEPEQQLFEVYTIPKAETGVLKMTVTALDAEGNTLQERIFTDVPVQRNRITVCRTSFEDNTPANTSGEILGQFTLDPEWDGEDEYEH